MELLNAKAGDLILFALGEQSSANRILGRLRLFIAHKLEVIDTVSHKMRNITIPIVDLLCTLLMAHQWNVVLCHHFLFLYDDSV